MRKIVKVSGEKVIVSNGKAIQVNTGNPVLQTVSVTPSTSAQTIRPTASIDGFNQVNVAAVTSAIDANIKASNIKKNVSILGVTGTYDAGGGASNLQTLNVTPSTSAQQITPTSPVDGFDIVNVAAVDASIDTNIVAGNIKSGVTILGVIGNYQGGGGSSDDLLVDVQTYTAPVDVLSVEAGGTTLGFFQTFVGPNITDHQSSWDYAYLVTLANNGVSASQKGRVMFILPLDATHAKFYSLRGTETDLKDTRDVSTAWAWYWSAGTEIKVRKYKNLFNAGY